MGTLGSSMVDNDMLSDVLKLGPSIHTGKKTGSRVIGSIGIYVLVTDMLAL